LLAIAAAIVPSSARIATANTMKVARRMRALPSTKSGRASRLRGVTGLGGDSTTKLALAGRAPRAGLDAATGAAAAAQNGLASGLALAAGATAGDAGAAADARAGASGGGMARVGRAAGGKGGGTAGGFGADALDNGGAAGGRGRSDESSGARGGGSRTGAGVAWREGRLIELQKITRLRRSSARSRQSAKRKWEHLGGCRALHVNPRSQAQPSSCGTLPL
jgi:hypothetical protein